MTRRTMVFDVLETMYNYKVVCQLASMMLDRGCGLTGCSSTRRKRKSCGVIDNTKFQTARLMVGSDVVPPVRLVRDLGIHLDSNSMMRTHVTWSVSTCLAALQQVRSMTVDQSFSSTIAHRVVGTITTGLRERDTGWPTCSSPS